MKNIFKLIAVAGALAAAMAGCVRNESGSTDEMTPVEITTRAAIGSEIGGLTINSVRIIAIDGTGMVVFNKYRDADTEDLEFVDGNLGANIAGNFIVSILPGTYDFYAIVNELASQWTELEDVTKKSDLEAIRLSATTLPAEGSMICVGEVANVKIQAAEENTSAKVVVEEETFDALNIPVIRAAVKLTLKVRKLTDNAGDSFTVKSASLAGVPESSGLLPDIIYDGELKDDVSVFAGSAAFTANSNEYIEVVASYIMPEYLLKKPVDPAKTTGLTIVADYTTAGGILYEGVEYDMTLLGDNAESYDLVRGTNYVVNVTINKIGGFDYHIAYEVAKWDKVTDDPTKVVIGDNIYAFSGNWAPGTETEEDGHVALVRINEAVTMIFTLSQPTSGRWTAQLSNPADFYFDDYPGNVRSGVARMGFPYQIVVRPRGVNEGDASTEIYINIDNGTKEIECDLINDEGIEPGKRYIIKQIPR